MYSRVRNLFKKLKLDDFRRVNVQVVGSEDTYGDHADTAQVNIRDINPFNTNNCCCQFRIQEKELFG